MKDGMKEMVTKGLEKPVTFSFEKADSDSFIKPSEIGEALPAVAVPAGPKAGGSLRSLASSRRAGASSRETRSKGCCSDFEEEEGEDEDEEEREGTRTGTTSGPCHA